MKTFKSFMILTITLLVLTACSQNQTIRDPQNTDEDVDNDYYSFTAEDENFRVQTFINKLEFKENEEIDLYSTIEYIGEKDSIVVWSGDPYFHHTIHDGQRFFNEAVTLQLLMQTTFKKGEIYTIPFTKNGGFSEDDPDADFWREYFSQKNLVLPKGEYTFIGGTAFTLDEEQKNQVALKNEFIVTVK